MLMCTYCALSPCELMLILMFRVNVGGGSFYLTSAFSGSRLWLIMANKQTDIAKFNRTLNLTLNPRQH